MAHADEQLTYGIIGAAIEVHRHLGPGLLESTYEHCLCHELASRSIAFARQVPLPVVYKREMIDAGYRVDILVEQSVILEIKSVDALLPVHQAQLLTYLKLSGHTLGLLMNFNCHNLASDGVKRLVRERSDSASAISASSVVKI